MRVAEAQRGGDRRRRVGRRGRHLRRRADVHADRRVGLGAGREERAPSSRSGSSAGRAWPGSRRTRRRCTPAGCVAPDLGGRELDVPQRHEAERDQPTVGVAAPLLDHPVVVGPHAGEGEVLVLALGERLAAEPGHRREAQRTLDVVDVHVREASLRLVATGAHLVVGDRRQGHLVARKPDRGDVALVRLDEVLVEPGVGLRLGVVPLDVVVRAARVGHRADPPAFDARAIGVVAELLRAASARTGAAARRRGRRH